jgi:hypothetical protein
MEDHFKITVTPRSPFFDTTVKCVCCGVPALIQRRVGTSPQTPLRPSHAQDIIVKEQRHSTRYQIRYYPIGASCQMISELGIRIRFQNSMEHSKAHQYALSNSDSDSRRPNTKPLTRYPSLSGTHTHKHTHTHTRTHTHTHTHSHHSCRHDPSQRATEAVVFGFDHNWATVYRSLLLWTMGWSWWCVSWYHVTLY